MSGYVGYTEATNDMTATTGVGSTALSMAWPTGVVEKDVMLAFIIDRTLSSATPGTPAGWTFLAQASNLQISDTATEMGIFVYYRILTAGQTAATGPTSWATGGFHKNMQGEIHAWRPNTGLSISLSVPASNNLINSPYPTEAPFTITNGAWETGSSAIQTDVQWLVQLQGHNAVAHTPTLTIDKSGADTGTLRNSSLNYYQAGTQYYTFMSEIWSKTRDGIVEDVDMGGAAADADWSLKGSILVRIANVTDSLPPQNPRGSRMELPRTRLNIKHLPNKLNDGSLHELV